jgi:hypothetical protein
MCATLFGVKRERAVALVEELLTRLTGTYSEWPLNLITSVEVFGSFARGALEPHDVDIAVSFDRTPEWVSHFVRCMSYGRNPYAVFRQPLIGRRPGLQFQFEAEHLDDIEPVLLWHRGESLDTALYRLRSITPDAQATRAPRDAMIPQFEGLDRWIPRPYRETLVQAIDSGCISIERLSLQYGEVDASDIVDTFYDRWKDTSPLFRGAHAVLAFAEQRGIDPRAVWLHGRQIRDIEPTHFADFDLRYFRHIPWCLGENDAVEWLAVVHTTRHQPLDALRILPLDREQLKVAPWG